MKKYISILAFFALAATTVSGQGQKYHSVNSKAIGFYSSAKEQYDFYFFDNAEKLLKQAIIADPKFYEAYMLLGELQFSAKRYPEAMVNYRKAVKLDSLFFKPVFFNLATSEMKSGDYLNALVHFRVYLDLKTGSEKNRSVAAKGIKDCEFALKAVEKPIPFNPVNAGDSINTSNDEYWPSLTADGQTMMFTRQVVYPNRSQKGQEDFYVSHLSGKGWTYAVNAGAPLNTGQNEGAQSISSDGTYMYFTACDRSDGMGRCDIYYSHFDGRYWSQAINAGPPINSPFWDAEPSVSANGKMLFFASNRPGGLGGMDIWYSIMGANGSWGEPKNPGPVINTSGDEMSPFIHFDGKTLYFASNGRTGLGGYDIFYTRMKKDSTWSEPVNLGYPINTSADETGLIIDASGQYGYFSTERDKSRGKDIYYFAVYDSLRPDPVSYFKGKVYDAVSMRLLVSEYELVNLKTGTVVSSGTTNSDGTFLVCLPSGNNYGLNVNKKGYLFYSDNFMFEGIHSASAPFIKNVLLTPIMVGGSMQLSNVFFGFDSTEIKKESRLELDRLSRLLKENPGIVVEVAGYTDSIGSEKYNLALSERRARNVVDYLKTSGIGGDRLRFRGYGSSAPVGTNVTEAGRKLNRRTEVKIIEKKK